jgi:anaerobic selenocysteine-containing dehydrogenase
MFNFIRLSDGGKERFPGPRGEIHVIAGLAARTLGDEGPVRWTAMRDAANIRQMIARAIPGFAKIAEIDRTKEEFQLDGRTFHTPQFPTRDGRAILHCHALPPLQGDPAELRLMTVRSEGQFNTVVYEEEDLYRGQERRDLILLHPDDLQRLGLQPDERVIVRSGTGQVGPVLARAFPSIRPGNALMYYPEANELVPRLADPASRTPAFKNVLVTVGRWSRT